MCGVRVDCEGVCACLRRVGDVWSGGSVAGGARAGGAVLKSVGRIPGVMGGWGRGCGEWGG